MKEENQKIDKVLKEAFKGISVEKPSTSFLDDIMSKIEELPQENAYKPLISSRVWWGIAATIAIFITLSFFTTDNSSVMNLLADRKLPEVQVPSFDFNLSSNFTMSKGIIYGVILASVLLLGQIYIIKNRFNKRFEIS